MNSRSQADGLNGPSSPIALPLPGELLVAEEEIGTEAEAEIDPESIVEAAEMLLREGAPHDFDVLVIGAGPGGLAAAHHAARGGLHVAIVEEREVGGVCLNRGCIPTKTLLESIGILRTLRRAREFGISLGGDLTPDFAAMHLRKSEVVASLRVQTRKMLEDAGVEIIEGRARFVEEHTVEIEGQGQVRRVMAVHVVIATGGLPARLPIPGADLPLVATSDEILEQTFIPPRLIVAGAGAVGVEFASIFAELGSRVTLLERLSTVLPGEDEDVQHEMQRSLEGMNIQMELEASMESIEAQDGALKVTFERDGRKQVIEADQLLLATGRAANFADMGLEKAGILAEGGKISVDEENETNVGGVYAIGDCIRRVGWAHQAALEGREVADKILGVASDIDARYVPACYYTFPEVASVGLTLKAAHELGIEARAGKFSFRSNGRAATTGDNAGFVKLVVENGSDRLLGCQIIGPRATEIINEVSVALRSGATAYALTDALHAHPTFAEVLPGAARAALDGHDV